MPTYTPTQERILAVLADGLMHSKEEMCRAIDSERPEDVDSLAFHLSILRKKLRPLGTDVICQFYERRIWYRHVRLLHSYQAG